MRFLPVKEFFFFYVPLSLKCLLMVQIVGVSSVLFRVFTLQYKVPQGLELN